MKPITACRLWLALSLAVPALAAQAAGCLPKVEQAWVRPPPVAMPMMAGFARISNDCAAPVAVVSASSLSFADVSLHQTSEVDGVSRMRAVERLSVPAGGKVELKPGGLHLMLYRPYQALVEGQIVIITLSLEDGRDLPVQFQIRKP
jgi:copper(I)-binding protein